MIYIFHSKLCTDQTKRNLGHYCYWTLLQTVLLTTQNKDTASRKKKTECTYSHSNDIWQQSQTVTFVKQTAIMLVSSSMPSSVAYPSLPLQPDPGEWVGRRHVVHWSPVLPTQWVQWSSPHVHRPWKWTCHWTPYHPVRKQMTTYPLNSIRLLCCWKAHPTHNSSKRWLSPAGSRLQSDVGTAQVEKKVCHGVGIENHLTGEALTWS